MNIATCACPKAKTRLNIILMFALGLPFGAEADVTTLDFTGLTPGSSFSTYTKDGYTVAGSSGSWIVSNYGHPGPSIVFYATNGTNNQAAIKITGDNSTFKFNSIDLYSSVTVIPYIFTGYFKSNIVFSETGTVPNTFGNFATVTNQYNTDIIDSLAITLTNPYGAFFGNPMGLDNAVVKFVYATSNIDTAQAYYLSSGLSNTVNPTFQGGMLRVDAPGNYTPSFSINASGGTIDGYGQTAIFSGVFSDAPGTQGALTIINSLSRGSVIFTAANTYTGLTTINQGATLALAGAGGIAHSSGVVDNGTLDISAVSCCAGAAPITTLSGNGSVLLGNNTLALTQASGIFSGEISGTGGLTIANGAETLAGANTYTGNTAIKSGASLAVNGSLNSSVDIAPGGTLRGTGLINGPVNVNGTLAPGNSPGTLTTTGTVTMNGGSVFKAEVDGTGTGNGAGNYSRLLVTGAGSQFVANGATLNTVFRGISGNASNNFTPSLGDKFTIVTAEGGIVGRFANAYLTTGLPEDTRMDAFYNVNGNHSIELFATPSSYAAYVNRSGANDNAQSVGQAMDGMRGGAMAVRQARNSTNCSTRWPG